MKQLIAEIKQVRKSLEAKIEQLECYVKDKDQVTFSQQQRIAELEESLQQARRGDHDYMQCVAIVRAARQDVERLRNVGAKLTTCAFNLAQKTGATLTSDETAILDQLRKEWDAAASV